MSMHISTTITRDDLAPVAEVSALSAARRFPEDHRRRVRRRLTPMSRSLKVSIMAGAVLAFGMLAACGQSPPAAPDAAAPDADDGPCRTDEACDDGRFCNGAERCAPEDGAADGRGCMPARTFPCAATQTCVELEAR